MTEKVAKNSQKFPKKSPKLCFFWKCLQIFIFRNFEYLNSRIFITCKFLRISLCPLSFTNLSEALSSISSLSNLVELKSTSLSISFSWLKFGILIVPFADQMDFLFRAFKTFFLKIWVKNLNFGQKSKFWWKIQILVKNWNYGQKLIFWLKIENWFHYQNYGQKLKIFKNQNLARNFGQKSKFGSKFWSKIRNCLKNRNLAKNVGQKVVQKSKFSSKIKNVVTKKKFAKNQICLMELFGFFFEKFEIFVISLPKKMKTFQM